MRYVKLGLIAAVVALGVIGILRITDVITPVEASWFAARSVGVIVLSALVGSVIGIVSGRSAPSSGPADRPIP